MKIFSSSALKAALLLTAAIFASCSSPSSPPSPSGASSPPSAPSPSPAPASFAYSPPGQLVQAPSNSGAGVVDTTIWAPGMRFPIDKAPAYADSQVWGVGGTAGPSGGQCDARNYSYPWHDNFCEKRATKSQTSMLCPAYSKIHQGQDIRPGTCEKAKYQVDAVEDGQITQIASYTVYLTGDSGRLYRYLHMQMDHLFVNVGDRVTRGQAIGLVSNNFGGSATTIHLHFEIKMAVTRDGTTVYTWVPPYTSLVDAYQRLLAGTP